MTKNSRVEAYFKLADRVRLGRVSLPDDDVLREELAFCRYDVESSPLKLVPKKKLPARPTGTPPNAERAADFANGSVSTDGSCTVN